MLNKVLYSLLSFLVALFFLLIGLIFLIFPWSATLKTTFIEIILSNSTAIFLFGFILFFIGLARLVFILLGMKRTYFHLQSGPKPISIDELIIQDYLDDYWKNTFPHRSISNRIFLKKNKIYVVADLPYVPINEQKNLIRKIQDDISEIFALMLGYKDSWILSANFQPKPKEK